MNSTYDDWSVPLSGAGFALDALPPKVDPIPEPMDADGGDKNAQPDESLSVGPVMILFNVLMDTVFRFKEPEEKSLLRQLCDALKKEDEEFRLDITEIVDMFYELEEGTDDVANVVAQCQKRHAEIPVPPPAAPVAPESPDMDTDAHPPELPEKKKEKKKDLRPELTCKVCLDNQVAVTFVPCGHLVTCVTCTAALFECPVCRAHIRGTVRTYV